jgi:predicted peptidase
MNANVLFRGGYYEVAGRLEPCALFVPAGIEPRGPTPIGLFLHGTREKEGDALAPTRVGLGPAISEYPDRFRLILAFPQCPKDKFWVDGDVQQGVRRLVDRILNERGRNNGCIFVTGLSEGGSGALEFALRYPQKVAALAPMCPAVEDVFENLPWYAALVGREKYVAARLKNIPIWLFHGDHDPRINVSESRKLANVIRATSQEGLHRYTECPGVNHHECWERAYRDPQFASWVTSHVSAK